MTKNLNIIIKVILLLKKHYVELYNIKEKYEFNSKDYNLKSII